MESEPFLSRFEAMVERSLSSKRVEIHGTSSSLALSFLLTQATGRALRDSIPFVITPTDELARTFERDVQFFDPKRKTLVLPSFDTSPYSGFFPSKRLVAERIRWLYHVKHRPDDFVFIASIEALLQKTLPPSLLTQRTFKQGQDLPETFTDLLISLGYHNAPVVEDVGSFAKRGGIVDVFSSVYSKPVRIELFGDTIESIRFFDPDTQKSDELVSFFNLAPAREVLYSDAARERLLQNSKLIPGSPGDLNHAIFSSQYFEGIDFLVPLFYADASQPAEYVPENSTIWWLGRIDILNEADAFLSKLKAEQREVPSSMPVPSLFSSPEDLRFPKESPQIHLTPVLVESESTQAESEKIGYSTSEIRRLFGDLHAGQMAADIRKYVETLRSEGFSLFIAARTQSQARRIVFLIEKAGLHASLIEENATAWSTWIEEQRHDPGLVHIVPRISSESIRIDEEQIVFLREDDFFDKKASRSFKSSEPAASQVKALSFGDLKPGDYVVHIHHGVGVYDGLSVMEIQGTQNEFIQLRYKDNDKLFLPVYKISQIQRFAASSTVQTLDKLGGTSWKKATIKVRSHLKEVASELLKLYAERSQVERDPYDPPDDEYRAFEAFFPYAETEDQLKAIDAILQDLSKTKPMDRLICGDVGFGKTEVAMRASFKVAQAGKQVAVLVPTTTLAIQHLETFKKRFKKWPIRIGGFSRFTSTAESNKVVSELKEGKLDIVIGTHRLFSRDIAFKDLGLLIVDEEQKFGVTHKEKIRRMRVNVDTIALSATPIPRTLNMSLMGIRDLSLINTPPQDRLPTRTFVVRNSPEIIRKAIQAEVARGGQVLFVHNRIQSIYGLHDELKSILPDVSIRVGHGQMDEKELENTIIGFFNNEFQVLLSTTIIESGMDIPRANTMIVDRADTFGLSQLYQLRGRVGRGQERAYCYLMIPPNAKLDSDAQERLKVLQENTALGSGLKIAHYDMELRGTGDILGEDQSGHISAVGYDLYLELLEEALRDVRGDKKAAEAIDPEINLRIPAFIPDEYIPDIRVRLTFYKMLSDAKTPEAIDRIEEDLRDRFGEAPEPALNLLGVSLIRQICQELLIKDVSVGPKNLLLTFSEKTPISPEKMIQLAMKPDKKYRLSPNNRVSVRLEKQDWVQVHEELMALKMMV